MSSNADMTLNWKDICNAYMNELGVIFEGLLFSNLDLAGLTNCLDNEQDEN